MKSDIDGVSQCKAGEEQWEKFEYKGKTYFQYDYRTPDSKLFSCIRPTLKQCRDERNKFLIKPKPGVNPVAR